MRSRAWLLASLFAAGWPAGALLQDVSTGPVVSIGVALPASLTVSEPVVLAVTVTNGGREPCPLILGRVVSGIF